MYKSQNQSLQAAMMANSLYTTGNSSLSPNHRNTSSQKKLKDDKKKKFKCEDLTSMSLQQLLFKPPLNTTKNVTVNNYLQNSLQLKSGGFQTLINEITTKESVPIRQTANDTATTTTTKRK
jgi:hypothetical protein